MHIRVFINQEGLPTYEAKDTGLIFTKWDDYKFDKSIIITANDIVDYMKIVLGAISELNPELPKRTLLLTHGNVKLPGAVKMSSRKGNFLKAVDILNLVSNELKNSYNSDDFTIALGAVKYSFLKYKIGGDIIFDPQESVKMTGNSGPYLMYSILRAKKIIANTAEKDDFRADYALNNFERTLVRKIAQYKDVLIESLHETAPHKLCNYLYDLAQEFSRFYENCPVVGNESEAERVAIVRAHLKVMQHDIPEVM